MIYLKIKQKIKPFIPKSVRKVIRTIVLTFEDCINAVTGKERDELAPPRRKLFVGNGDFKAVGEEFFTLFKEFGELKPNENVLDIGCGIGRIAAPLTKYLSPDSRYEGIDIVRDGIVWCNKHYTKYPNFHFTLTDIYNKEYNPKGKYNACDYCFPFDNDMFDFVFLISVFTHMLPLDMENYIKEISRVLLPGGRCLVSYFFINDNSLRGIADGKSMFEFKYIYENYRTEMLNIPEAAVAYDEIYIIELFKKYGLDIYKPIQYGSWSGRDKFLSFQDIIMVKKL